MENVSWPRHSLNSQLNYFNAQNTVHAVKYQYRYSGNAVLRIRIWDPVIFYPLDPGGNFSGSRIRPLFDKFFYIIFRTLVILSFLNWATLKTYR
jgi:hypothetical protein